MLLYRRVARPQGGSGKILRLAKRGIDAGPDCSLVSANQGQVISSPAVIQRPDHTISRARISENALKVLYRLKNAGFESFLVGGGVRDLLLGREPKDFDVATDARPDDVRDLFRNCRLIGRRFRLAHVRFGPEVIEVATFRARHDPDQDDDHPEVERDDSGRILRDNVYGTLEEDAWRRDFTVNALYYNIRDFSICDYVGGMADLRNGVIRLIGDPETRYREDPVRMLRAVRFAVKLGFRLHPETEEPLERLGSLLKDIPPARLFEEVLKLFLSGNGLQTFEMLRHYDLFRFLFPEADGALAGEEQGFPLTFVARALANTDERIQLDKPVTPAFLFAALLWEPVRRRAEDLQADGMSEAEALREAAGEICSRQQHHVAIPRRFGTPMQEIFFMQARMRNRTGKRALRVLGHPRFRAAYDFLLLRAQAGEEEQELADFWTRLQTMGGPEQRAELSKPAGKRPRRRRRRRKPETDTGG